jgi:hypothetical protein
MGGILLRMQDGMGCKKDGRRLQDGHRLDGKKQKDEELRF